MCIGRFLLLAAMAALTANATAARDGTRSDSPVWRPLSVPQNWEGSPAEPSGFDLDGGLVMAYLPVQEVEGSWLRLSGSSASASPDFAVWLMALTEEIRPASRPLPTVCTVSGARKVCTATAWLPKGYAKARASFYAGGAGTIVEPGVVEVAAPSGEFRDTERYYKLLDTLKDLYYLSHEVDWEAVRAFGFRALDAPLQIDPVPQAMALAVSRLPETRHMRIFRTGVNGGAVTDKPISLPYCVELPDGTWRMDVPSTPDSVAAEKAYIAAAHACFASAPTKHWLVNLTENAGGDAALMFAALAPVLPQGPQMRFGMPEGQTYAVVLGDGAVTVGGELRHGWDSTVVRVSRATAVIGKGCGSSCEALAIAALGRLPLVGSATQGLTTANETMQLTNELILSVTSGYMLNLDEQRVEAVQPDKILSDEAVSDLLSNGIQ